MSDTEPVSLGRIRSEAAPAGRSIDGMLDKLASQGDTEAISRVFTVDEKKALEKLRGVLTVPEHWALKAVQAGVAGGCSGISFRIGRNLTEVQWSGIPPMDASVLADALARPTRTGVPFQDELLVGLRALVGYSEWEFLSDGTVSVNTDQQVEITPNQGIITTLRVKHPGEVNYLGFRSQKALKATVEQAGLLRERCSFCPIPVRLDGKLVQHQVQRNFARPGALQAGPSPLLLVEAELGKAGEEWGFSSPPQSNKNFAPRRWEQPPVLNNPNFKVDNGKLIVWSSVLQGEKQSTPSPLKLGKESGRVFWLRYGVVSAGEVLYREADLGVVMALDAGNIGSDLSGLSLSEPPIRSTRLLELLAGYWNECRPLLLKTVSDTDGSYMGRRRMLSTAIGLAFGLPVALFASIVVEVLTGSISRQAELIGVVWLLCGVLGFLLHSEEPTTPGGEMESLVRRGVSTFSEDLKRGLSTSASP